MHDAHVHYILLAAPFVFGAGVAAFMFWLFDLVIQRLPLKELLKNIFTVITWFFGNGAIVLGTLKFCNLNEAIEWKAANGVAFLCYLLGFGLVLWIESRRAKPSLLRSLHRYLTGDEVDAILVILKYGFDPDQAAAILRVEPSTMVAVFESALRKLNQQGKKILQLIRSAPDASS